MVFPAVAQTDEAHLQNEYPLNRPSLSLGRSPLRSLPQLDSLTGGFWPGQVAFIESSTRHLFPLTSMLCAKAALEGEVVFLDGGNSIDPYGIARICKSRRIDPRLVLSRIHVARAFTAYQLATLVDERLGIAVRDSGANTVVVSCLLEMFFDKDIPYRESYQLIKRCLGEVGAVARENGVAAIVTHYSQRPLSRRLTMLLESAADVTVALRESEGALTAVSRYGESTFFIGRRRAQRTIDQFRGGFGHGQDLADV